MEQKTGILKSLFQSPTGTTTYDFSESMVYLLYTCVQVKYCLHTLCACESLKIKSPGPKTMLEGTQ